MRLITVALCFYLPTALAAAQVVINIDPAQVTDKRLPCNRGAQNHCDLRIYQVMVESFVDGDSQRGFGAGFGPSHHQGDLQGIINSLDYIRSLNVNAIWLTPIFDTDANNDRGDQLRLDATGYFAHDFFKIDPHFGTLTQAKELVQKAHQKGLYVFFDGAFGHTKQSGVVPSPTGLMPTLKPCGTEYGDNYPGLCVQYPQSRDFFAEVATYWMREIGIDGWRLDQAYQVPVDDLHFIQDKILATAKQTHAPGYVVAEIWRGKGIALAKAIQHDGFGTAQQPGVMSAFDFPMRFTLLKVLATQHESMEQGGAHQSASLLNGPEGFGSHNLYPDFAIPNLMIGNHDTVRFGNLLARARIAKPDQANYWKLHRLAFAFLTAYSGPITLYYGDEIGDFIPHFSQRIIHNCAEQNRRDDHVSRTDAKILGVTVQAKDLDPRALQLKNYVARLMQLKSEHPALSRGARTHLGSGKNYYVDLKTLGKEKIIFIMNTGNTPQSFLFKSAHPTVLKDLLSNELITEKNRKLQITLPALESRFFLVLPKSPPTQEKKDERHGNI